MRALARLTFAGLCSAALALLATGCTTAGALITLAGISTDTSMTWTVMKYFHAQITEGDPRACVLLNSAERALSPRCGAFVPGSIVAADIERTGLAECSLTLAARDPVLWPVLGELLDKGAKAAICVEAPLAQLARLNPCPDFAAAAPASRAALARLARFDPNAVHHDVMRMLSCPTAVASGLDDVLDDWRTRGLLQPGKIGFSPLGALHPSHLASSTLAADLEADGHRARDALGGYFGRLPGGYEEALRTGQRAALGWWLQREPGLANLVPPTQGNQLPWVPLARVLVPSFLADPDLQGETVTFLLEHGADPNARLPFNPDQSVVAFARQLKSPMLPLLQPSLGVPLATRLRTTAAPR